MNESTKIHFVKMTGAGNDFVLVDNIEQKLSINWQNFARTVCNRRYGVGADGLLILEQSTVADFKMSYFNFDGSFGGMCGNGGRCIAFYAMEKNKLREVKFDALNHIYSATQQHGKVILQMKDPTHLKLNISVMIDDQILIVHFIDSGAPHTIVFIDEFQTTLRNRLEQGDITELGKKIRFHDAFAPVGTNVDFVSVLNQKTISVRTYERGVEGETLACGTGSVAGAVVSSILKGLTPPIEIKTHGGELLKIDFKKKDARFSDVRLQGSAKIIYHGELNYSDIKGNIL